MFFFNSLFIYVFCLSGYVLRDRNRTAGPRTMNYTGTAVIAAAPNDPVDPGARAFTCRRSIRFYFLVFVSHSKQIHVSGPV